jgi:hypothetical protein
MATNTFAEGIGRNITSMASLAAMYLVSESTLWPAIGR